MVDSSDDTTVTIRISQPKLRTMFMVGCWLHLALVFVPAYGEKIGGFFGIGAADDSFSTFDAIRAALSRDGGEVGGLLGVLWFSSILSLAVLAMKHPRRWVFLSGACVASFFLILSLFAGVSPNVTVYPVPELLRLSASAMEIAGFWIRPARLDVAGVPAHLGTLQI